MKIKIIIIFFLSLLFSSLFYIIVATFKEKTDETAIPAESLPKNIKKPEIETAASGLSIPWEIAFLPDGGILATERPGRLLKITGGKIERIPINGVSHIGEGGLLGLAVHPDFSNNGYIYLYMTGETGGKIENRVERHVFDPVNNSLSGRKNIIDNIPGSPYHNGGRIAFGPDGYLYIATGDAGSSRLAQDLSSLAGKILRLRDGGGIPDDNPFGNPVFSYGHRNPQGLAWDSSGRLWANEHGPSGASTGHDEINIIEKGGNYGWPDSVGGDNRSGSIPPVLESGSDETWAPGGLAISKDTLYFTGLRGQALYTAAIEGDNLEKFSTFIKNEYGRLRAIKIHDGYAYISTSNTDGRGNPEKEDDRIIKIPIDF